MVDGYLPVWAALAIFFGIPTAALVGALLLVASLGRREP